MLSEPRGNWRETEGKGGGALSSTRNDVGDDDDDDSGDRKGDFCFLWESGSTKDDWILVRLLAPRLPAAKLVVLLL